VSFVESNSLSFCRRRCCCALLLSCARASCAFCASRILRSWRSSCQPWRGEKKEADIPGPSAVRGADAVDVAKVFKSIRAIECARLLFHPKTAFALIKRYARKITKLSGPLCLSPAPRATMYWPGAHGLSPCRCARHLRTLRVAPTIPTAHIRPGGLVRVVSMAAIASGALPRLHTLDVLSCSRDVPATSAGAGFFEDLLPRLHAFGYAGWWPQHLDSHDTSLSCVPLPHLRTLVLRGFGNRPPPWEWFMGARPLELCTYSRTTRWSNVGCHLKIAPPPPSRRQWVRSFVH
jgi:hypothetical protein